MPSLGPIAATLSHRNYRVYMAGNAVSLVGLWTQRVATGWLAWDLTESATWLGVVAVADLCPSILIGPFAGVLADRVNRLHVIRSAQTVSMLQAAVLAVLAAGGWIGIEALVLLVLLNGIVVGVNQPSRLALVSSLVPRANLSTAVAINSITFNVARFVGPAVAGVLIVSVGVGAAFAVNAASFLAFLLALSRVRLDDSEGMRAAGPRSGVLADIVQGVRYVRAHAAVGPLLLLATVNGVGLRCVVELLPGFAAEVFARGAGGLAVLASAVGVGAVGGGFWLARRSAAPGLARVAVAGSLGTSAAVLAFAASPWFWPAAAAAVAAGTFMSTGGIATQTCVQMAAEPALRGRTLALYGIIMRAAPALGALILGAVSDLLGLRGPLAVSALLCLAVAWAVWRRRERLEAAL
jgi:predicted MFS family arabinose efflux permease